MFLWGACLAWALRTRGGEEGFDRDTGKTISFPLKEEGKSGKGSTRKSGRRKEKKEKQERTGVRLGHSGEKKLAWLNYKLFSLKARAWEKKEGMKRRSREGPGLIAGSE